MLAANRQLLHLEFPWTRCCHYYGESLCSRTKTDLFINFYSFDCNNIMWSLHEWMDKLAVCSFGLSWTLLSWWWLCIRCTALPLWSQTPVAMTTWGKFLCLIIMLICRGDNVKSTYVSVVFSHLDRRKSKVKLMN